MSEQHEQGKIMEDIEIRYTVKVNGDETGDIFDTQDEAEIRADEIWGDCDGECEYYSRSRFPEIEVIEIDYDPTTGERIEL